MLEPLTLVLSTAAIPDPANDFRDQNEISEENPARSTEKFYIIKITY